MDNFFLDNSNAIQPFNWKKAFPKTHFGSFLAPENYRVKLRDFSRARKFRALWETPESVFGSFTGSFSGPRSSREFWETHARSLAARHSLPSPSDGLLSRYLAVSFFFFSLLDRFFPRPHGSTVPQVLQPCSHSVGRPVSSAVESAHRQTATSKSWTTSLFNFSLKSLWSTYSISSPKKWDRLYCRERPKKVGILARRAS